VGHSPRSPLVPSLRPLLRVLCACLAVLAGLIAYAYRIAGPNFFSFHHAPKGAPSRIVKRFIQEIGLGENRFLWLYEDGSASHGVYHCTGSAVTETGSYEFDGKHLRIRGLPTITKSAPSTQWTTTLQQFGEVPGFASSLDDYPFNRPYLDADLWLASRDRRRNANPSASPSVR
jgi:hypothetical protein